MKYISIFLSFLMINTFVFGNQTSVSGTKGLRFPNISPDTNSIAFVHKSDIWTVNAKGGQAKRLTTHPQHDTRPIWSPDGKWIAFASKRGGDFNVWVIPSQGGEPRQITWDSTWDSPCSWSKDGKTLYFCSYRDGKPNIWKIPIIGGFAEQLTFDGGRYAAPLQDQKNMIFANGSVTLWQQGYRGSSNWDLFQKKNGTKSATAITNFEGNDIRPIVVKNEIFYLREATHKTGKKSFPVYNIWKMKIGEYKSNPVSNVSIDIHSFDIATSSKFCVFEMNFVLWKLNLDGTGPQRISIQIDDKQHETKTKNINITSGSEMGHWSPDGKYITFAVDGDLYIMNSSGGAAQQITNTTEKEEWPRFSPDGKKIAYCVAKNDNSDIHIYDITRKKHKQITHHASNDFYHSWSPDGRFLAFTSERSGNRDIWKLQLEDGSVQQVTHGKKSEDDAVYSPDGRWLAFDSGESGTQEIWVMPTDGTYKEAKQVTKHKNLTQVASWSADSKWLVYETHDKDNNSFIRMISRNGGESMLVEADASVPCWSPLGDKILFESRRHGKVNIYQIEAPQYVRFGKRIPFLIEKKISELSEKQQVFNQALDYINRGFYDPKLHGKDWKKLGESYRDVSVNSATEEEMYFYMNRMLGELEASHLGISRSTKSSIKTGQLGWTLQKIPGQKGLRVVNVVKDGPADKAWVRKGDFVFQIEETILSDATNLSKLLNNKIGKSIRIFASPRYNVEDGRYIKLKPVSINKILSLKYNEHLRKRMALVRNRTNNKILYLHLRDMSAATLQQFRQVMQRYSNSSKGMIMDLRDNVGGNIHQQLLTILQQKPYITVQTREGKPQSQPDVYWGKPVVVIINENSFSDAEVFAHAFKQLKLGDVVGIPTSGGVIGTRDIRLSNGATFRIPVVGYYTTDGKNMEGLGVKPNHVVKETSQDRLQGKDPQLDLAINLILKQIKGSK
ncbi:S41 family peptidase [Candidatus Uabimicrobium sp. HlEnr_7]|uniref:S41 family peptidase n=1 Tax=Candidatus Uabimicrobium helgolandensis TaxID=3095367 RepID=UPI0035560165